VNRPREESLASRRRLWAPLVVVAAVLAGAAPGAAAAAAPLVRVDVPRFVSRQLPLEVRLGPGARLAHVAVDRRNVTGRLRGRGTVLRARLPRRLLRRGPNHVTVAARDRGGRPVTVTRRSFLLPARLRASRGALADAGPDVGGVARRPIRLDGSGSLARGGRRLFYTWRIVRAPRGSHPRLRNRHRRRARLIARRPGTYRLALTVTKRRGARRLRSGFAASIDDGSRDFANAQVSPAMTPQGLRVDVKPSTGINFTAPDGSATGPNWGWQGDSGHAHMLVLDRTTLQPYRYTLPTDATIDSTLDANLKLHLPSTGSSSLAILTGAPGCCDASKTLPHDTAFSYVFVPRTGKDDIRTGVSNEGLRAVLEGAAEPGEITGALQPSPDPGSGSLMSTVFSFTQTDVLPYDTNASVDPDRDHAVGRTLLIQSIGTSMVVDNPGGTGTVGQPMEMFTRLDNQNQGWTLTDTGAGGGYVELVNQASNLCLDASADGGGGPPAGTVVRQAACTGGPGQLWRWDRVKGSELVYYLSPKAAEGTNLVLSVSGPNTRQLKTGLVLLDNTQDGTQKWRFALPGATFRVGDRTYNVPPPGGSDYWNRASFAVLALDPSGNPLPGSPKRFDVVDPDHQGDETFRMYNELQRYATTPGTTVLIQSIRNPNLGRQHQSDWSYWLAIGRVIPGLGGSQWAFDRLTDEGGYALVGCAGCDDAAQSAYAVTRNLDDGRLSGLLIRDGDSRLAPLISTAGDEYEADVTSLASQAPTPWPFSGTAEERAMLGYVADKLKLTNLPYPGCAALAPVRDAYCNANFVGTEKQNDLKDNVSCAAAIQYGNVTIDTATCSGVRSQLLEEFGQVDEVQKFIANLKEPLVDARGNTPVDLADLTNKVNDKVGAPSNAHVGWSFYEIVESLGEIGVTMVAEEVPGLEKAWTIATQAINATRNAAELIGGEHAPDGTSADELTTEVSALGSELQARYRNAASNLSRLGALLVSDPDKLATAADKSQGPWEVPDLTQDQPTFTNAISAAARQWLYTSLMHEAYQLHSWDVCAPWINHGSYCYVTSNPVNDVQCRWATQTPFGKEWNYYFPFRAKGEPASATFVQPLWRPWDSIQWTRVLAIARGPIYEPGGKGVPSSFAVPSAELTNSLFQPFDLRKNSGGVGLYPEYFFEPAQWGGRLIDDNQSPPRPSDPSADGCSL
jgi:ricin-type beta-trefoil lectin protein